MAIIQCCKELNSRLEPIRQMMPAGYTWEELIAKATSEKLDLCSRYWITPKTETPLAYNVYAGGNSFWSS